jgi:hypothetical protein
VYKAAYINENTVCMRERERERGRRGGIIKEKEKLNS